VFQDRRTGYILLSEPWPGRIAVAMNQTNN
jgi:hypothetical protein